MTENTSVETEQLPLKERLVETVQGDTPVNFAQITASSWFVVRVVLITLFIVFVAGFVASLFTWLIHLLFLIVLSVSFAYLMEPLVKLISGMFEKLSGGRLMPRSIAIALAYLIVFLGLGVSIAAIAPLASEQAAEFGKNLPEYSKTIQDRFSSINTRYRYSLPKGMQENIATKLSDFAGGATGSVGEFLLGLVTYLPWLVLIPILAFFFLKDINLFRISLLRVMPHGGWRTRVEAILEDFNRTLAAYARAQLISCVLIGTICTAGFYLIGLNYAVLLGILAGIFEFIPLIGPLTVAVIVILTGSFSDNPYVAVYAAIFLIVLRIVQDYVFYPRIVREGIHLHPLAIILSVLAGEEIAGIAGVFISIPVVALVTVLYKHILEHSGNSGILTGLLAPKENPVTDDAATGKF